MMMRWLVLVALLAGCPGGGSPTSHQRSPKGGGKIVVPDGSGSGSDVIANDAPGGGGLLPEPAPPPLHILDEEPVAVGAIDRAAVRRVVRGALGDLQICYERVLLGDPTLGGHMVVSFTIEIDGTPHDLTASGVHPDVESCALQAFRSLRFPRPEGAKVTVQYPLELRP